MDNEVKMGTLYLADGKPAANARVRIFPVGYAPDSAKDSSQSGDPALVTRTDEAGRYSAAEVPDGRYNILADLSGQYSYLDSLELDSQTVIPSDTLGDPGAVTGYVRLQPNHDPQSAFVQVMGTYVFSNVDAEGQFRLEALAGGKYTLRISVSGLEYTPLFRGIKVESGKQDTIGDTLAPAFLGVPVVTGYSATFDTLRSIVHLAWKPASFRNFSDYLIFRDASPALELSKNPVALTVDTTYSDTLVDKEGRSIIDSNNLAGPWFEYRIRAKNKSDKVGESFGYIRVRTPPKSQVRTHIGFRTESVKWDSSTTADSIRVSVSLSNPTRKLKRLIWSVGSPTDTVLVEELDSTGKAEKALQFGWSKEGPVDVHVAVEDDGSTVWAGKHTLLGNSAPKISGQADSLVKSYVHYKFQPVASDPDKDTLRFSIINLPHWARFDSSTGTLTGTSVNADTGAYTDVTIRVSDGRRHTDLAPFKIKVLPNPWIPRGEGPVKGYPGVAGSLGVAVTAFGKIFLFSDSVWSFDPGTGKWANDGAKVEWGWNFGTAEVIGERIFLFGQSNYAYHPISKSWEKKADPPVSFCSTNGGAMVGGIFYTPACSGGVWGYDPDQNQWSKKSPLPTWFSVDAVGSWHQSPKLVAVDGKILYTNRENQDMPSSLLFNSGIVGIYDPAKDVWSQAPSNLPRVRNGIVAIGKKVYLFGGLQGANGDRKYPYIASDRVEEFDISSETWKNKTRMPYGISVITAAVWGGKVYVFQGLDELGRGKTEILEYDPALDP